MDRQPTHEELTQRIKILEKEAQKDKQRAGVLEEERWKLSNLVKELNCLFGLSELVARQGNSVEEILQGVVDLLPSGCQFPDICHARIVFDGRPYTSKGFAEGNWKQIADIVAHGKMVGTIEVFYVKKSSEYDEGPFLKEERLLLTAIAERLGRIYERITAEIEKEKLFVELKQALADVKTLTGFLPICAKCKKIRDDKGYWNQIESYISEHSDALFSHSICPACAKQLYPDFHHREKQPFSVSGIRPVGAEIYGQGLIIFIVIPPLVNLSTTLKKYY